MNPLELLHRIPSVSSSPVGRFVYGASERHALHAHDYANISVVLAGSLSERVGRTEEVVGPLSVVVKPVGTEHANTFGGDGAVLLRLNVPQSFMREQEDGVHAVSRWKWIYAPAAARWLIRLALNAETDARIIEDGIAECLGATDPVGDANQRGSVPTWLLRIRERITDEGGVGLRVSELASDAGVHPVYLTRRFRATFGCSVVAAIQAMRMRKTANALGGKDALSQIALASGFSDQAHMTRVFARVAGISPGNYRALVHGTSKGLKSSRTGLSG